MSVRCLTVGFAIARYHRESGILCRWWSDDFASIPRNRRFRGRSWIFFTLPRTCVTGSRPSRGGADRNRWPKPIRCLLLSPLTRGRGSKPGGKISLSHTRAGRPSRGGADRNARQPSRRRVHYGRPSRGGADRNMKCAAPWRTRRWSPLTRGRGSKRVGQGRSILPDEVAPHAGARIETSTVRWRPTSWSTSPLTRGRGSKRPRTA